MNERHSQQDDHVIRTSNSVQPSIYRLETPSERTNLIVTDAENVQPKDTTIFIIAMSCVTFTHGYIVMSVFPYAGFLAIHLISHLDAENAGTYAGLVASAFMVGRMCLSFEWGQIADRRGRKFVIQASLLLSALFSLAFSFASTFGIALFWRFMLGLGNGIDGSVKTIISEFAEGDDDVETKTMSLVLGMKGYGYLIGPAFSACLSEPVKLYPNSEVVHKFEPLLSAYPFVLPNVVACVFCVISIVAVHFFVEETMAIDKLQDKHVVGFNSDHPLAYSDQNAGHRRQQSSTTSFLSHGPYSSFAFSDDEPHIRRKTTNNDLARLMILSPSSSSVLAAASQASFITEKISIKDESWHENYDGPARISSLWKRKSTRQHLLIYWVYSFLVIAVDESIPLFCISIKSGLGVSEKIIGQFLVVSGFSYFFMQYYAATWLVRTFGLYEALHIGTVCSAPIVVFIPLSLIFNRGVVSGHITVLALLYLGGLYSTIRAFTTVVFATVTITTNRTVPPWHRASLNGFAMLGGSISKAAGPAFSGMLFSWSVSSGIFPPPWGTVFVFGLWGFLGLLVAFQSFRLKEDNTN
mmetsp:Transcript_12887/g.19595  ORF Transcript_12887/g.19595 Transcript_12887/m.19595 type:complete len:581 (+) Transcript_12887:250-1992(+)|eukprot:CAMPEP_0196818232 /NCGR_PEP_ID=MMETSP1362-20130617/64628_1 /TAXON_ID=163516 /ORGANISM="Leptocylindrus danicus, Strain CCMP1856" /LENGTH=580 /DNA_ID=CAMNT_0042196241 /DNA_START=191 /DNA_END=1933 /DNA_ORIENTATION=-